MTRYSGWVRVNTMPLSRSAGVAFIASLLGIGLLAFVAAAPASAAVPKLTTKWSLADRTVDVHGTIGQGGPASPPRSKWRALLEEKSGSSWKEMAAGGLTKKGKSSAYALEWSAPLSKKSAQVRVEIVAKKKSVVASQGRRFNFPTPLRFDISSAHALAVVQSPSGRRGISTDGGTNLDVVADDGSTTDAATSGDATVEHMLIAPNNHVYVTFKSPGVNLSDTSDTTSDLCVLAELDPDTQAPECIESSMDHILWTTLGINPPIQLGPQGAIYYMGYVPGSVPGTTRLVLRRSLNGVTTDLAPDAEVVKTYLVLPDDTVIISGYTKQYCSSSCYDNSWTKSIDTEGNVTLLAHSIAYLLHLFPDGNAYIGFINFSDPGEFGVARYLTASNAMDPRYWIAADRVDNPPYHSLEDVCGSSYPASAAEFCIYSGSLVQGAYDQPDGRVLVLPLNGALMSYYPDIDFLPTAVTFAYASTKAGNKIALAGRDADGETIVTLFDPSDDSERQIADLGKLTVQTNMGYSPAANSLFMITHPDPPTTQDFVRLDLETGELTSAPLGATWSEFATLR
jgi:hypothetical protein